MTRQVKHIDTEEESQDCPQSEYTTPFYTANDQAKASVKCLKTTTKLHYMKNRDNEHIRPLWVDGLRTLEYTRQTVKSIQGLAAHILPVHRAKELFGKE